MPLALNIGEAKYDRVVGSMMPRSRTQQNGAPQVLLADLELSKVTREIPNVQNRRKET